MSPESIRHWDERAEADRRRFTKERDALHETHKGSRARKVRAKKDPVSCFIFVDRTVFFTSIAFSLVEFL